MRRPLCCTLTALIGLAVQHARATPVVQNAGFDEATTPALSGDQVAYTQTYGPLTSVPDWSFGPSGGGSSYDGVGSGSTFINEGHGPHSGTQNAFVQGTGSFSQSVAGFTSGYFTVSVYAISRTNGGESIPEPTAVTIDGTALTFGGTANFQAGTVGFTQFTSDPFYIASGDTHLLGFSGTVPLTTNDNLTGLDDVSIAAVPEPAALSLLALASIGCLARRRR